MATIKVIVKQPQCNIKTVIINKGQKGSTGATGPMGPVANFVVDKILLNASNIISKSFALSAIPADFNAIELTPLGGIIQSYGIDYVYANGTISWGGLGLDGFLEQNEQIIVRYIKGA